VSELANKAHKHDLAVNNATYYAEKLAASRQVSLAAKGTEPKYLPATRAWRRRAAATGGASSAR